jgi:hypothetical protein
MAKARRAVRNFVRVAATYEDFLELHAPYSHDYEPIKRAFYQVERAVWRSEGWLSLLIPRTWCRHCRGSVTAPDGPGTNFTGQWSGSTSQGASIAFSVSADQTVTAITVGHDFNACRGTETFSSLSLDIAESGFLRRVPIPSTPGFGFGSGSPEGPNFTQVTGMFTSSQAASGTVTFLNFANCGNTVASWNATRR